MQEALKRKKGLSDVSLTKVDILVPKTMLSITNGLENNLWFIWHMAISKNNLFFDSSIPGLLKINLYDIDITHKHYVQLTGKNIEFTGPIFIKLPLMLLMVFFYHIVYAFNVIIYLIILITSYPLLNN